MFTKVDKMWVAALVSFLSMTAMQFWGLEIGQEFQNGLVAVLTAAMVWLVPNKQ